MDVDASQFRYIAEVNIRRYGLAPIGDGTASRVLTSVEDMLGNWRFTDAAYQV